MKKEVAGALPRQDRARQNEISPRKFWSLSAMKFSRVQCHRANQGVTAEKGQVTTACTHHEGGGKEESHRAWVTPGGGAVCVAPLDFGVSTCHPWECCADPFLGALEIGGWVPLPLSRTDESHLGSFVVDRDQHEICTLREVHRRLCLGQWGSTIN